ncbi:DUF808 domain-containing protein [Tessaracoccus sp. MC1756]|uniref:DUF808 domain-containing protein n=1 Tax=Tessaracoccus sp. MC1756 TaxID=2760311 RepID=UPI0016022426|nr:DUF808 domain-containing protein [Tessaracoccus sp. MC1756]MBB1510587.1 DUF808 domain-containing protein [Tessaracoccus sp. MC1756]
MAGGLAALLDDIAAIARAAAASVDDVAAAAARASSKAVGVVVDDTAVTPRYVQGFSPDRELPVIWRIAKGSIVNKLVFILPAILLLSQFANWALTPLLMLGGLYLSYEGVEKIWESVTGHSKAKKAPALVKGADHEKTMVSGAIRTDFILSAEIMVISLNEVTDLGFWMRAASMVAVALAITVLVYGVVAIIVKMDDLGLHLAAKPNSKRLGEGLVKAMPVVLSVLSTVGIAAMLWVGGHILLVGMHDLGFHPVYTFVHDLEAAVGGGLLGWLVNTFFSAVIGIVAGAILVAIMHLLPFGKSHDENGHPEAVEVPVVPSAEKTRVVPRAEPGGA